MKNFMLGSFLKIALILKTLIISGYLISHFKFIRFGEDAVIAQDKKQPDKTGTENFGSPSTASNGSAALNSISRPSGNSFLDQLLNLPKFSGDDLKKNEVGKYLKLLERKKFQVENRAKILQSRVEKLKGLEKNIDEKLVKLEEEVVFFQQTQQKEKSIKKERLDKLVAFYQKMEPKKAAPVFAQLDRDLVVSLFNRIPQKQTTKILGLMGPERSVALSEYYGRMKSAKEYKMLKEINVSLRDAFDDCKTN